MANITKIQIGKETYNISDPTSASEIEKSITQMFKISQLLVKF
jgi:hypothetical protein